MKNWKEYWDRQTTPLHRHNTPFWYELYAREINLILRSMGYNGGRVLELGCGNGALYEYLEINRQDYTGVDFSSSLTEDFSKRHPHARIVCQDIIDFEPSGNYSLIFSNGVIQNISPDHLRDFINKYCNVLEQNGIFLSCNIPYKKLRSSYASRELREQADFSRKRQVIYLLRSVFRGNSLGHWYSPRCFIRRMPGNMKAVVFGSLFLPYRFSIALIPEDRA